MSVRHPASHSLQLSIAERKQLLGALLIAASDFSEDSHNRFFFPESIYKTRRSSVYLGEQ